MTDSKEVMVYPDKFGTLEPLDFGDIRKNTQLIKKVLREVLTKGVDYGTVPGCGDKLGLFKPGAEKLMLLFKLGCFPEVQRLHDDPDALEFVVKTRIVHIPTGRELGVGLGSSSSNEEKYRWRAAGKKEWENTPEERRRFKYYKGDYDKARRTYGPEKEVMQVRTNPADLNNTLLKMACKRSKVDAVITCTGASDIFTQDTEENEDVPTIQTQEAPLARPEAKQSVKEEAERPVPMGFRLLKAIESGKCKECGTLFQKGATVAFNEKKGTVHPDCVTS